LNDLTKQILLWVALAVILLAIFSQFGMRTGQPATIDYSQFLSEVKSNSVDSVTLKGEIIEGKRRDGNQFVTYNPETGNGALIEQDGFRPIDEARSSRHRMRLALPPGTDEQALFDGFQTTLRQLIRGAEKALTEDGGGASRRPLFRFRSCSG